MASFILPILYLCSRSVSSWFKLLQTLLQKKKKNCIYYWKRACLSQKPLNDINFLRKKEETSDIIYKDKQVTWFTKLQDSSQMRFSLPLINAVLFLIPPCSQADCRRDDGGWLMGLEHCIVLRKWSFILPVVSLHLPFLPVISMQQHIAAHLVTVKWYSAGKCLGGNGWVWDPAQQAHATDSHVKRSSGTPGLSQQGHPNPSSIKIIWLPSPRFVL